ncbi:DUF983 domain-containing protein [Flavobacterium sp.]|jgi:uncharacterized protein (DUF983 family)|uniref:DUF983 domain-containing protein n=1 Tax=Flavobacterium sp. TaxID=239 RepID=UPI0037BF26A5
MLKKGSKLYSILTGTCPQCQKESMYEDQNLLHLSKIIKMNEKCSHCNLRYQIEPSFFYGAMYVSYGLNVAIGILTFIIVFQFDRSMITSFISIFVVLILSFPVVMRLSRNLYINFFVSYNPEAKN